MIAESPRSPRPRPRALTRWGGAGLGLWLALAPVAGRAAAGPEPTASTPGQAAHEAGLRAYERGDYREAMEHFERAHRLDAHPADLYGWAQAARSAGDCRAAVELYQQFIDLGMEGDSRAAAEQNQARCREQLEREGEATVERPPEPTPEPEPAPSDPPARDPRAPDALDVSLLVVGGASLVAGAALLGIGESDRAAQRDADEYARFDALDGRIDALHIAGGIALGVGATLAVAGTIRLVLRRSDRASWDRRVANIFGVRPALSRVGGP